MINIVITFSQSNGFAFIYGGGGASSSHDIISILFNQGNSNPIGCITNYKQQFYQDIEFGPYTQVTFKDCNTYRGIYFLTYQHC